MSQLIKKKNEKKIIDYIKSIMMNRDIDCDNDWWESEEAKPEISSLADTNKFQLSNSEKMKINSDKALIFMSYFTHEEDKNLIENLNLELDLFLEAIKRREHIDDDKINIDEVDLVIFVSNYKSKIRLKKLFDKEFEEKLRSNMVNKGYKKIKVDQLYVFNNASDTEEIKIGKINRYETIQMPPINNNINWESFSEENSDIFGFVFNVELYQLVELYNKIGDQLFKKNVRYGINEQFGVDSAIKDTLEKSPSMFWFRNNGVTLLVEKDNFKLDRVGEIVLSYDSKEDELDFSVVNGAQTIIAAADFYYTKEYEWEFESLKSKKEDLKDALHKAKEVRVMLRIINIKNLKTDTISESNQISVALNRQKPIKAEDIAFSSPFIGKLISYLEKPATKITNGFKLVKRGELLQDDVCISLPDFVRARKACIGKPGDARSKGINQLLEYSSDGSGYSFKDKEIFTESWEESEGEKLDELFGQKYGAILFAVKLAEIYDKNRKNRKNCENRKIIDSSIVNNGKWYFVSLVLAILTESTPDDYSNFDYKYSVLKDHICDLLNCFNTDVEKIIKKYKSKYPTADSNVFKKDSLYKDIKKDMLVSGTDLQLKIKVLGCFSITIPEKRNTRRPNIKIDTVVLKSLDRTISVKDQTEALIETFKAYLNEKEFKLAEIVDEISILSFDKVERAIFRNDNKIDINGKMVYIGTSIDFDTKIKHLNNLANYLKLSKDEIMWKHNDDVMYFNDTV